MNLVTERRALRKEEEDDEKEVKEAREMKLKNIIQIHYQRILLLKFMVTIH